MARISPLTNNGHIAAAAAIQQTTRIRCFIAQSPGWLSAMLNIATSAGLCYSAASFLPNRVGVNTTRRIAMRCMILALVAAHSVAAELRQFRLAILKRQLAAGQSKTLRVAQGDVVELSWSSDEPVVLHLHGYDIEIAVTPGSPALMRLDARASGR